ncbi:MAG: hypothetical protein JWP75_1087, partial [Frondihabitans sp.]|nr:hypothetical protein [Frondihabitans sp.]
LFDGPEQRDSSAASASCAALPGGDRAREAADGAGEPGGAAVGGRDGVGAGGGEGRWAGGLAAGDRDGGAAG